jgi:hypothetical protein
MTTIIRTLITSLTLFLLPLGAASAAMYKNQIGTNNLGSFQIEVPAISYQYNAGFQYMPDVDISFVSFGPTEKIETEFRLIVMAKRNKSLQQIRENMFAVSMSRSVNIYGTRLKLLTTKQSTINGYPATYRIYSQADKKDLNKMYLHIMCFVDYGKFASLFWLQNKQDKNHFSTAITGEDSRFIHSFSIL